ncbi:MAG: hypothetical protein M1812_006756 [Candelaria pacifica]|nr:MAG: hypothetical protein M1812_006756 [Candelaria pacifica]
MVKSKGMNILVPDYGEIRRQFNEAIGSDLAEGTIKNLFTKLQRQFEPHNQSKSGRKRGIPQGPRENKKPEQQASDVASEDRQPAFVSAKEKPQKRPAPAEEGHASGSVVNVDASRSSKRPVDSEVESTNTGLLDKANTATEAGHDASGRKKAQTVIPVHFQTPWPKDELRLLQVVLKEKVDVFWEGVADEMRARGSRMNATGKQCKKRGWVSPSVKRLEQDVSQMA